MFKKGKLTKLQEEQERRRRNNQELGNDGNDGNDGGNDGGNDDGNDGGNDGNDATQLQPTNDQLYDQLSNDEKNEYDQHMKVFKKSLKYIKQKQLHGKQRICRYY